MSSNFAQRWCSFNSAHLQVLTLTKMSLLSSAAELLLSACNIAYNQGSTRFLYSPPNWINGDHSTSQNLEFTLIAHVECSLHPVRNTMPLTS